jgi:putative colanic acid biosynthesis UDP-glucose lipid carrier transferase
MLFKQGRYSGFITPLSYIMDLMVVNLFTFFLPINFQNPILFHSYITVTWIVLSFKNQFYEVHRYSKVVAILRKIFTQFVFFFLILYAYIGFFKQPLISRLALGQFFVLVFVGVTFLKFLNYILLMQYRGLWKGNIRRVVIIGKNNKTDQLIQVFNDREEYGYKFVKQFDAKGKGFDVMSCFMFIANHDIDEIYCSVSEMSNKKINAFINFADNNLKTLKFLPDNKNIFAKKLKFEYYDYLPILSLRDIPLHTPLNG